MKQTALQTICAALITFTALTCALPVHAATKTPARPNIIVIFTDDQTYGAIGYNNPTIKTPRLDALAASGIRFERAYVASPICAASRASMMTGLFPQQHVYPTVLELAGAPAPPQPIMGKSPLPLLKDPRHRAPRDRLLRMRGRRRQAGRRPPHGPRRPLEADSQRYGRGVPFRRGEGSV